MRYFNERDVLFCDQIKMVKSHKIKFCQDVEVDEGSNVKLSNTYSRSNAKEKLFVTQINEPESHLIPLLPSCKERLNGKKHLFPASKKQTL